MPAAHSEVIVIGAGPAGSSTAHLLAKAGRQVSILEATSLKHPKVCGGLLNRRAWELVGEDLPAGILLDPEEPDLEYHDLDNSIRARYYPGYHNIDRQAFDAWLLKRAIDSGAELRLNHRVTELAVAHDSVKLSTTEGEYTARFVIDASGWAAVARKTAGYPAVARLNCLQGLVRLTPPPGAMWAIYRSAYTPFFGWIIPKGQGTFLLGAGLSRNGVNPEQLTPPRYRTVADRPAQPVTEPPGAWPKLAPLLDYLEWRGHQVEFLEKTPRAMPLTYLSGIEEIFHGLPRLFAVGEAAGLVSPFSGEGISYALLSARHTADTVIGATRSGYVPDPQAEFSAAYDSLRFAAWKAKIGASAFWRPWGLMALPLVTGQKLTYLPWVQRADKGI